jgi:hypothetical protein
MPTPLEGTEMSYKTREKKRAAKNRAVSATRAKHRSMIAGRHYLTFVKHKTCCARCAGILKAGGEMVYRHTPRESLCRSCAESDPAVVVRPSERWTRKSRAKS